MLIRMVEVVEVREQDAPLNLGLHRKTKLASAVSLGRQVRIEIDQPVNDPLRFDEREEMLLVLIPAKSLVADFARALSDPGLG